MKTCTNVPDAKLKEQRCSRGQYEPGTRRWRLDVTNRRVVSATCRRTASQHVDGHTSRRRWRPDAGRWRNNSDCCTTRVACHRYRSERFLRADAYVRTRHCTTPQASEHCLQRCLTGQTLTDCESSAHRRFRAAGAAPSATRNENLHECPGCKAGNGAPAGSMNQAREDGDWI